MLKNSEFMTSYAKTVNCGEMQIDITLQNGKYSVSARMKKFGDCSAYAFISDEISRALNSGETTSVLAERLKQYKCKVGKSGCITAIGECLDNFLESKTNG